MPEAFSCPEKTLLQKISHNINTYLIQSSNLFQNTHSRQEGKDRKRRNIHINSIRNKKQKSTRKLKKRKGFYV